MDHLIKDLRVAFRALVKKPALSVTAVLALSLGIGLTTAMFSIVRGTILRGLPFDDPQEIMALSRHNPLEGDINLLALIHDFVDWRERQTTFEGLAASQVQNFNLSGGEGRPEQFTGAYVTPNTFGVLGVAPMLGRDFREEDAVIGGPAVMILSHALWRDRFSADPGVVGRTARVNGQQTTIIGVMPERFEFPVNQKLWLALRVDHLALERGQGPGLLAMGRLRDGVAPAQAQAEFSMIAAQLGREYPKTNAGMGITVSPYVYQIVGNQVPSLLFTMLGAVSLVLLIACANVANLLLARAASRTKEVAVRTALGASRRRVIVQMLAESFVLSAAGALVGMGIAQLGIDYFNGALAVLPQGPPFWLAIRIDPTVLLFVLLLALVASLLSGIIPAFQASGTDVNAVLKDESRGASSLRLGRLSRALVVSEIAMSCALLVAAGLMIKTMVNLGSIDMGIATDDVFTASVTLSEADYPDQAGRVRFFDELLTRLQAKPGVRAAAATTNLPVVGFRNTTFAVEGRVYEARKDYPRTRIATITPSFLEAIEAGVIEGRNVATSDDAGAVPVALVSERFVTEVYGGESPIGKRIRLRRQDVEESWLSIVGVVPDLYLEQQLSTLPVHAVYMPLAQQAPLTVNLLLRTEGDPTRFTSVVRDEVTAMDPDLPVYGSTTLRQSITDANWFFGVFGGIFATFGLAALMLAAVGLYGVMSFSVSRRTHEVGLRVALGARPGDVVRLVLRQGFVQLGIGIGAGLALAAGGGRLIGALLFEVEPTDPSIHLIIVAVLAATGFVACFVPARRATRVDPMVAMRAE